MNRPLNDKEISYVLYHLDLVVDTNAVRNLLVYSNEHQDISNRIVFTTHGESLNEKSINDLLILFASDHRDLFSIDPRSNLIFHHDFLKSAFYLLSGYDEKFVNKKRDHWDRVQYTGSIQKRLGIITRPLVNEYFEVICNGLEAFFNHQNQKPPERKNTFRSFAFLLSHDIDTIDKYGWPHLGFKIKELLGISPSIHSKRKILFAAIQSFVQFINPWRRNPYWNFDQLLQLEKDLNIKASYYFLSKAKTGGSSYRFDEKRLKTLFRKLHADQHEIGIHGTNDAVKNVDQMIHEVNLLEKAAGLPIVGSRQHRLWLKAPETYQYCQKAGLSYDTTLGFAEHEGFRNSFCLPFKPYDFDKEQMIDLWQLPLIAMDVTLFSYRKLKNEAAMQAMKTLLGHVKKHRGILTLLWHNSFFDEVLYPDIKSTYEGILKLIMEEEPMAVTGEKVVNLLRRVDTTNEYT